MANIKKFESPKKDMNFFSEFTTSSSQMRSYSALFLLAALALIVIGAGVFAVYFFQSRNVLNTTAQLKTEMQSEEYQNSLTSYSSIGFTYNTMNQEYYEVTNLYYRISDMEKADSKYMDAVHKNLPADITLTNFEYMDGYILLTGLADSYYSPLALIASLSKDKVFTYVDITSITQLDLTTTDLTAAEVLVAKQYAFTIKGSLETTYAVKVTKMLDGVTPAPLTAVTSTTYAIGDTYKVEGINTYTNPDNTYTLSRVEINDNLISDATAFAAIQQADALTGPVQSAIDITLYYTLSSTNGGGQG